MQSTCIWLQPGPDFPDFAMNWKIHIRTVGIREFDFLNRSLCKIRLLVFTKSKTFESVSVSGYFIHKAWLVRLLAPQQWSFDISDSIPNNTARLDRLFIGWLTIKCL